MKKAGRIIGLLVVALIALWLANAALGMVTGWLWANRAAPWENVHAFYYPDRNNLTEDRQSLNIGSVEACRDWVHAQARELSDPSMQRGDYECGVGCKVTDYGMHVCRLTVE